MAALTASNMRVQTSAPVARARAGLRCAPVAPAVRAPSALRARTVAAKAVSAEKSVTAVSADGAEAKYLASRCATIQESYPSAMPIDDFLLRVEMALCAHGFNGDNSIGICNLCRDESTNIMKRKIEEVFPLNFNINGLGGSITCGVVGMGAGLSHSPTDPTTGKKKYIFFSFPHIAIDVNGKAGPLARPGQQACNSACGAMLGALGQLSAPGGLEEYIVKPGMHDANDPEFSILKQRLARRIIKEDKKMKDIDLVGLTQLGERQITADLEFLISKAVDPATADYAIITGTQIHNWGTTYDNEEPNLEFVAPTGVSVVINGERTALDISKMPALTPRQVKLLSKDSSTVAYTGSNTVSALNDPVPTDLANVGEIKKDREAKYLDLLLKME